MQNQTSMSPIYIPKYKHSLKINFLLEHLMTEKYSVPSGYQTQCLSHSG